MEARYRAQLAQQRQHRQVRLQTQATKHNTYIQYAADNATQHAITESISATTRTTRSLHLPQHAT
eukprot:3934564-Amphidinium_carterae.1